MRGEIRLPYTAPEFRLAEDKPKLIRDGNKVTVVKHERRYTFIYGNHAHEQDAKQLPFDLDSLVLETGNLSTWVGNSSQVLNEFESSENFPQYRSLLRVAKEKNLPIIFADLAYKNEVLPL